MDRQSSPVRVTVISPFPITRAGVVGLLAAAQECITVVDARPSGDVRTGADVVLYDLMLTMDGSAGQLARLTSSAVPVVALSVPGRPDLTDAALTAGAVDVVDRSTDGAQLVLAIQRAARGFVAGPEANRAAIRAELYARYGLTDREATILALIASGMSNQDIATHLYLSVNSIKTYIRTAYRRIGARSRSEALLWALRHNLAEADPRSDVEDEPVRT